MVQNPAGWRGLVSEGFRLPGPARGLLRSLADGARQIDRNPQRLRQILRRFTAVFESRTRQPVFRQHVTMARSMTRANAGCNHELCQLARKPLIQKELRSGCPRGLIGRLLAWTGELTVGNPSRRQRSLHLAAKLLEVGVGDEP